MAKMAHNTKGPKIYLFHLSVIEYWTMSDEGVNNTPTNVTTNDASTVPSALTTPTTNTGRGSRRGERNINDRNSSNSVNNNAKTRTSGLISLKDFKGLTPEIEAVLCLPTETCPNKKVWKLSERHSRHTSGQRLKMETTLFHCSAMIRIPRPNW